MSSSYGSQLKGVHKPRKRYGMIGNENLIQTEKKSGKQTGSPRSGAISR